MSAQKTAKLKVISSATRNYINVPSSRANALHNYLRAYSLPISPPQPSSTDIETIDLGKGLDVKTVQALLDKWV